MYVAAIYHFKVESRVSKRILRKIAEGDTRNLGDTSTLADPAVVGSLVAGRVE